MGSVGRILIVIGEVEAGEGIELRREAKIEIGEEGRTAEARVDLYPPLIIEPPTDEVADILVTPRGVEVAIGDVPDLEDVLPPVGAVVVEGIQRVLDRSRRELFTREDVPVGPEVVIGPIVGRSPAVGARIAIGEGHTVGTPVIVSDTLCSGEHEVYKTLSMPSHL